MIKYENYDIVFREIPDKVSLAINITNCQNNCLYCHSKQLKEDIGKELTNQVIDSLISQYEGVECIVLMGEGNDVDRLFEIAKYIKSKNLLIALYSGSDFLEEKYYFFFDYLKIGRYDSKLGGLSSNTTNQRLYKIKDKEIIDITYRLQRF